MPKNRLLFPAKMFQMAKDEQTFSHKREIEVLDKDYKLSNKTLNYFFWVVVLFITGGVICILFDKQILGSILVAPPLLGLSYKGVITVWNRLFGKKKKHKN